MMMERNKKRLLLVLHVALFQVCVVCEEECQSFSNKNLTCYNDYVRNITCTYTSDHMDNVCTIHAFMNNSRSRGDPASCKLEPIDVSRPELKKCSLILKRTFKSFTTFLLRLSCVRDQTQNSDECYRPLYHIKLAPPKKPNVNYTTVSWKPVWEKKSGQEFQLQWKRDDQSWSDPSVLKAMKKIQCDANCEAELNPDSLIQDESYKARIQVRVNISGTSASSTWSDWSPTASWVSLVGRTKQKQISDAAGVWWFLATAVAVFAVFMVLIFRTNKTTWVYVIKWIKGPPLPSFLQDEKLQKWQSSFFTSESYLSFFKPLDIDSVEVTHAVDDIAPSKQQPLPLDQSVRDCSQESSSSSFSSPSYSQLCPVPQVCSLSAGNLEPCAADSPYGPAGGHDQSTNPQQDVEKQRGKDVDMQLLSKANNHEPLLEISDYEKVEKLQVERDRLQSVDSGMCSGEEVSQESLEPDSITQSLHEEEPESKKQWEEGNGDCFQKLFGHSNIGDGFSKGSIEVCSDYEQVQKLQVEIPDDVDVDSDLGISRDQQLSHHHILSTPSTRSLSDSPSTVLLLPSINPLPLNFTRPGSSPGPGPLAALIALTVMSNNSSLEPSADGYLPVTREEC